MNRRLFTQLLAAGVAGASGPVRIGFVGVGGRGTGLLRTLLDIPGVTVPALCDINEANLARAQDIVGKTGSKRPEGYSSGPEDFRRLVARDDLDAVINATPWELHTPVSVAAMKAGKYAGTEVPAATTLEQCWELVNTSEKTGVPCMMLENVCYFRNALLVLNLVRQGLLGEILHCEGGYQHEVRRLLVTPAGDLTWRGLVAARRDGNHYPTHPIGPIAWWMDINRGDRFTYLTSMSTVSRGINEYARKKLGPDHPLAKRSIALGNTNTSLIKTANGHTVTLYYDVQSPRPYDLIFRVQGTEGIYSGTLNKIYIEGRSPKVDTWEDADPYYQKYEHPLWKSLGETATNYGHGGADYITLFQFVEAVRNRAQPPIDVYDSATWSAIFPLSEASVASGSAPQQFPDFTRGRWKTQKPVV